MFLLQAVQNEKLRTVYFSQPKQKFVNLVNRINLIPNESCFVFQARVMLSGKI